MVHTSPGKCCSDTADQKSWKKVFQSGNCKAKNQKTCANSSDQPTPQFCSLNILRGRAATNNIRQMRIVSQLQHEIGNACQCEPANEQYARLSRNPCHFPSRSDCLSPH